MKYENVKEGVFIKRPNRFIAIVEIDGQEEVCHVKNTGRLGELLYKGARVFVEEATNPARKTKYDLIAVYKNDVLYNIDSQMPNKVFYEFIQSGGLFENITLIKPECKYKSSRFDFYVEHGGKKAFVEVKGVTLERDNVMLFPDAPTERGVKHINELIECVKNGYETYAVFIIGADAGEYFTPNRQTHNEFAGALENAKKHGVKIIALKCEVTPSTVQIKDKMDVKL